MHIGVGPARSMSLPVRRATDTSDATEMPERRCRVGRGTQRDGAIVAERFDSAAASPPLGSDPSVDRRTVQPRRDRFHCAVGSWTGACKGAEQEGEYE